MDLKRKRLLQPNTSHAELAVGAVGVSGCAQLTFTPGEPGKEL